VRTLLKSTTESTILQARHDPYAALRFRDFRFLLAGQFLTAFGTQMVSFGIGWELWLRTHDEFALALVGLVQVIPVILLSLPAGNVADNYNRKRIVMYTQILLAVCSFALAILSWQQGSLFLIYLCLFGIGVARSFYQPAASTLMPQTVPPEIFTSAATWGSTAWQLASIIGPAFAGLLVANLPLVAPLYAIDSLAGITFLILLTQIKGRELALSRKGASLESLKDGLRFIRDTKVILAAITLDMFAVLFGGAVALLPVYATDILKVGADGYGLMRAAPSIGAIITVLIITRLPPFQRAGRTLLVAVAGFGVATIIFGASTSFPLSLLMLAALGGLDSISVVIRSTLSMTWTPDEMRGRTSAVNSIFIGASNELGSFESGVAARLFGTIPAVIAGGIGTIIVVLSVAKIWPEMRNLKTLEAPDYIKNYSSAPIEDTLPTQTESVSSTP
jgi:MFS family permease